MKLFTKETLTYFSLSVGSGAQGQREAGGLGGAGKSFLLSLMCFTSQATCQGRLKQGGGC